MLGFNWNHARIQQQQQQHGGPNDSIVSPCLAGPNPLEGAAVDLENHATSSMTIDARSRSIDNKNHLQQRSGAALTTSEIEQRYLTMTDERLSMLSPPVEQTMITGAASSAAPQAFASNGAGMRHVTPMPPCMFSPAFAPAAAAEQQRKLSSRILLASTVPLAVADAHQATGYSEYFINEVTNDAIYDSSEAVDDVKEEVNHPSSSDALQVVEDKATKRTQSYMTSLHLPVIVHRMIHDISLVDSTLMHWSADGELFWIDQGNKALGGILSTFFKHGRYQSLRRQLNSYGFGKILNFPNKGYWKHTTFRRDSSYETLVACKAAKRQISYVRPSRDSKKGAPPVNKAASANNIAGSLKSESSHDAAALEDKVTDETSINGAALDEGASKVVAVKAKTTRREVKPKSWPQKEPRASKRSKQSKKAANAVSFEVEFSGDIAPDGEDYLFPMDLVDEALDTPVPTDAVDTTAALTTLATAASFLSTFSPVVKDETEWNYICKSAMKNAVQLEMASPTAIKMTVVTDLAHVLLPSPLQVSTASYPDFSRVFSYSNGLSQRAEETMSEYSMGSCSLSTPLRSCEKSAFTPVSMADMKNRSSPEFYETFVGMTGTLFEAVGISSNSTDDDATCILKAV